MMITDNNHNDHSIAKSWLFTLLTVIANMTLNDVATVFVIMSAGVSTGYTAWKWLQGMKDAKKD
jgi:hypothetical protein